jgi:flagellar protein FliO/FliZ
MSAWRAILLGAALVATPSAAAEITAATHTGGWVAMLQALVGLLVVLGLLYGFLMLLRRFGPSTTGARGIVKVVGGVMLSPRERLVMVEVQDTWLLLGVASGQVNLVHAMPRPEHAENSPVESAEPPFASRLADFLRPTRKD